jgi:epothilone synthetase B
MDIIDRIPFRTGPASAMPARTREQGAAMALGQGMPCDDADTVHHCDSFLQIKNWQPCCTGSQANAAAHGYLEIEACGADLERLEHAFNRVIARHDMLRAVVLPDGSRHILPDVPYYPFPVEDLAGLPAHERATRLAALRDELSHHVLRADSWPRYAIRASRLPDRKLRLHLSFDPRILDARSLDLLSADWQHYHDHPEHDLPALAFSFADYEAGLRQLERTRAFRDALQYWRGRLDDLPPPPALPLARSPESAAAPVFTRRSLRLPHSDWEALKKRAGALRITPAALLLSIYGGVLQRWSASPRFTLQLKLCSRLPFHADVGRMVGDFTTATLLAFDLPAGGSFVDSALGVQRQLENDLEHRAVDGAQVLCELAGRGPDSPSITQAATQPAALPVVFTSALDGDGTAHRHAWPFDWLGHTAFAVTQAPGVWLDCQAREHGGELAIDWDSADALFAHGQVDAMFDAFTAMLQCLARDGMAWRHPQQQREVAVPVAVVRAIETWVWPALSPGRAGRKALPTAPW